MRYSVGGVVDVRLNWDDLDGRGRVDFLCPSGFCRARAVEPIDIAVAQHPTELTPGVIGDVDVVVEPDVLQEQVGIGSGAGTRGARDEVLVHKILDRIDAARSAEHTSELQSLMRISYAVFLL